VRATLRLRWQRAMKSVVRKCRFLRDVWIYLERGHDLSGAIEEARKVVYP